MPVQDCKADGKPGYRWGEAGKCYTYTPDDEASRKEAKRKAHLQGAAIGESDMGTTETLTEYTTSRGIRLTAEPGVVKGVKILGLESTNGRTYPKETVARAIGLYEGAKVNVNHPPRGKEAEPRAYQDRIGTLHSVRLGEGKDGLFADLKYNPEHPVAKQLAWDAENAPENVGLSHNVEARTSRAKGGRVIVEEILRVQSVDLVADPATTRGLFEDHSQEQTEESFDMDEIDLKQLRESRPDLVEAIEKAAVAATEDASEVAKLTAEVAGQATQIKTLTEQSKTLSEELDKYKAAEALAKEQAEKTEAVDKLLAEAKLPEALVTDIFRQQLMDAEDDEHRKAIIEDRKGLAPVSKPKSKEQRTAGSEHVTEVTDGKSLATAITR